VILFASRNKSWLLDIMLSYFVESWMSRSALMAKRLLLINRLMGYKLPLTSQQGTDIAASKLQFGIMLYLQLMIVNGD